MGGRLLIDSTPGEGTTASVALPARAVTARVLLADDERDILEPVTRWSARGSK